METDDRDLVLRAREGDADAFSAIVERHWAPLVRMARSIVGEAAAEDMAQESLVAAWKRLGSLREPGAFPWWIRQILVRRCLSKARWQLRWMPWSSAADRPDPEAVGLFELVDVERMLAALPPRQRVVMHMTVIEGMSDSETGRVLEIDAASVRSHRRRAREQLRRSLAADARSEEMGYESPGR